MFHKLVPLSTSPRRDAQPRRRLQRLQRHSLRLRHPPPDEPQREGVDGRVEEAAARRGDAGRDREPRRDREVVGNPCGTVSSSYA